MRCSSRGSHEDNQDNQKKDIGAFRRILRKASTEEVSKEMTEYEQRRETLFNSILNGILANAASAVKEPEDEDFMISSARRITDKILPPLEPQNDERR